MLPEPQLQTALARAELHLGTYSFSSSATSRALLFSSRLLSRALALGRRLKRGRLIIVGYCTLSLRMRTGPTPIWSHVIARDGISDEARACSLNNRADIFERRGAQDAAIRDRSQVLALQKTSPDRRYIALIRRSRSYTSLGGTDDAIRDLDAILKTEDIAPEQKAQAHLPPCGTFSKISAVWRRRQMTLALVLAEEELFPGTAAKRTR